MIVHSMYVYCDSMKREPELVKVLIAEADTMLALGISVSLQQYGYVVAGIASQTEEASRLFKENDVDIVLINQHIPGDKGAIETVLELMKIKRVPVIYLIDVADDATISSIKQTCPVAFIAKPYDSSSICTATEMAIHNFIASGVPGMMTPEDCVAPAAAKKDDHDVEAHEIILRQGNCIFIKRNFRFVKINLREILYMEAEGNYVHIIIVDKNFTIRLSLMQVMRRINYSRFARINRSSVVNVDAIQSFNKEQVFIAHYKIAIGKNYKASFFRQLGFR
jgi:two-component system, response regulator PdtaR